VIAHVEVDELPPAGACGDDDRTRATRVLSAGPVVHHAVRVVDVKLDTDAGVRIHGELLAALVVVVVGFEDHIDLATEEEIHDVRADLAPVLARGNAVLVHPDEDPWDARGASRVDRIPGPVVPRVAFDVLVPLASVNSSEREVGGNQEKPDDRTRRGVVEVVLPTVLAA